MIWGPLLLSSIFLCMTVHAQPHHTTSDPVSDVLEPEPQTENPPVSAEGRRGQPGPMTKPWRPPGQGPFGPMGPFGPGPRLIRPSRLRSGPMRQSGGSPRQMGPPGTKPRQIVPPGPEPMLRGPLLGKTKDKDGPPPTDDAEGKVGMWDPGWGVNGVWGPPPQWGGSGGWGPPAQWGGGGTWGPPVQWGGGGGWGVGGGYGNGGYGSGGYGNGGYGGRGCSGNGCYWDVDIHVNKGGNCPNGNCGQSCPGHNCGQPEPPPEPCRDPSCLRRRQLPRPRCPQTCPYFYNPVCASDGLTKKRVTYANECELEVYQCLNPRSRVNIDFLGPCTLGEARDGAYRHIGYSNSPGMFSPPGMDQLSMGSPPLTGPPMGQY